MDAAAVGVIRVFIASPFFDEDQLDRVKRLENALSQNPYVADIFSARLHQHKELPFASEQWRKVVFNNDLRFLRRADVVVVIHDYEGMSVDSGTAFEVGYAYAFQKPIILVKEKESVPNLMLVESAYAYFTRVEELATYNFMKMPRIPYQGDLI